LERNILLTVLAAALLALAVALLLPGGRPPDREPLLPWDVRVVPDGSIQVFGLTLGRSPLSDARLQFRNQGEVNLFASPDGGYSLEAYFDGVSLSGLKADLVLTLDLQAEQARAMFERGLRISQLGSGGKKVDLAPRDLERAANLPIRHVTYLPTAALDGPLIQRRFGEPQRRVREPDSGIEHWLYPQRGLDIAVDPQGPEVFQYLPPREFHRILEPLLRQTES
jgi:hypothetical protein